MNMRALVHVGCLALLAVARLARAQELETVRTTLQEFTRQATGYQQELPEESSLRADLDRGLQQFTTVANRLLENLSDMQSAEDRAQRRQQDMEEKGRWYQQLLDGIVPKVKDRFAFRKAALDREFAELQARRSAIAPDDEAAGAAFNRDNDDYNRRVGIHDAEVKRFVAELEAEVQVALAALQAAMQEFREAHVRNAKLVDEYNTIMREYADAQHSLTTTFAEIDDYKAAVAAGLRHSGRVPSSLHDTEAFRDLRVVVRRSRAAANERSDYAADAISGDKFDTPVNDDGAEVPLEFDEVPAVLASPVAGAESIARETTPPLNARSEKQTQNLTRLDELYRRRNQIMRDPQAFAPDALHQVINDITATHSQIIAVEYQQKVAQEGSRKLSLVVPHDDEDPATSGESPSSDP